MNLAVTSDDPRAIRPKPIPIAVLEALVYAIIVGVASLSFILGWLTIDGATVLLVCLLAALLPSAWLNLGHGRHPCFLFLLTLTIFQGGRLVAFCLGLEPHPLRIALMGAAEFAIPRDSAGVVLWCIGVSAIIIYLTARFRNSSVAGPPPADEARYLPFLYFVFFSVLPFQLYKNYIYAQYAQAHGYLSLFSERTAIQANTPLVVRLVSQLPLPVFFLILIFESGRGRRYLVTLVFLASTALVLLSGQRGTFFMLIISIWYVGRFKSLKRARVSTIVVILLGLTVLASSVQTMRQGYEEESRNDGLVKLPALLIRSQGASLGVTETAVAYREYFEPYGLSYLMNELGNAFVYHDARTAKCCTLFTLDVSWRLNRRLFERGLGAGGSYIGEAYILGGVFGVLFASLLIGLVLDWLYKMSSSSLGLVIVGMTLVDVLWLPRAELLNWVSGLARNLILLASLGLLWVVYSSMLLTIRADNSPDRPRLSQLGEQQ